MNNGLKPPFTGQSKYNGITLVLSSKDDNLPFRWFSGSDLNFNTYTLHNNGNWRVCGEFKKADDDGEGRRFVILFNKSPKPYLNKNY